MPEATPAPAATTQTAAPASPATPAVPVAAAPAAAAVPATPAAAAAAPAPAGTPAPTALTQEQAAPAAATVTVPESYTFKLPEGMTLDQKALDVFTPLFKEAGLTNEQAQKLLDANIQNQQAAIVQQATAWLEQSKADKDLGGANFDKTCADAQAGFAKVASPALKALMESTGLGNHPEMLRMFAGIQRATSEPGHITGGRPVAAEASKSMASRMFPNMK